MNSRNKKLCTKNVSKIHVKIQNEVKNFKDTKNLLTRSSYEIHFVVKKCIVIKKNDEQISRNIEKREKNMKNDERCLTIKCKLDARCYAQ